MQASPVVRALVLCALAAAALPSLAQQIWKWRDANGQLQISDRAPPATVPAKDIVQRPSGAPAPAAAPAPATAVAPEGATTAALPASAGSAPAREAVDPNLARKKAELERQKAEQDKAAREAARQLQDATACRAAQEQLRTLQSGVRLSRVNAQGDKEFIDDAAKAQMAQQAQGVVQRSCH